MKRGAGEVLIEARELVLRRGQGDSVFELSLDALALRAGEVTAVLGPNGSGKTTLLRVIAGVERVSSGGELTIVRGPVTLVSQRPIAFAGTVAHNVSVGLLGRGLPRPRREALVADALSRFGIEELVDHDARTLSGGELRRLALARAVVIEPSVLLLDEPFDDLDAEGQRRLSTDLLRAVSETGIALVVVTHDLRRALLLADRIVVLLAGSIAQQGPRDEILRRPASPEIAKIVGMTNLALGRIADCDGRVSRIELGPGRTLVADGSFPVDLPVWIGIRPEHLKIDVGKGVGEAFGRARVESLLDDGLATVVQLEVEGQSFTTHLLSGRGLARRLRVGDEVDLAVDPEQVHVHPLEPRDARVVLPASPNERSQA
jgi:ABC-type Fe3+/spermidine/putrescine transport system ATPase subunit